MQLPAFELIGLSKTFGTTVAADRVDLAVPQGSFYGLVGPNGAGKTTALSMGVGLLRPDAGTARVLGVDIWAAPIRAKGMLGVLPDGLMLPERLTGQELLTYLDYLRGMPADVVASRSAELLDVLDLASAEETLVIEFSTGMRKKIGLAVALLHGPGLLVLDEPFESVDPVSASVIRTILQRYVRAGNTRSHGPSRRRPARCSSGSLPCTSPGALGVERRSGRRRRNRGHRSVASERNEIDRPSRDEPRSAERAAWVRACAKGRPPGP